MKRFGMASSLMDKFHFAAATKWNLINEQDLSLAIIKKDRSWRNCSTKRTTRSIWLVVKIINAQHWTKMSRVLFRIPISPNKSGGDLVSAHCSNSPLPYSPQWLRKYVIIQAAIKSLFYLLYSWFIQSNCFNYLARHTVRSFSVRIFQDDEQNFYILFSSV